MRHERYYFTGAALLLLAAAAAVYIPGLHGPFVFDDLTNILNVPGIRLTELSFDSLQQAWRAREFDILIGRPIAMLSFGLNYYFAEFEVFYYKLTNLLIHIATGIALFALTLMLLQRHKLVNPSCPYQPHHLPWLALAIGAVWLLHPLNLTSVLYIVQRMTSLSALFTVLGLIGYCRGREQIVRGNKLGFATILLSLVLFGGLATLCKENGLLLLPLAALVEIAFYRFAAHASLLALFRRFWLAIIALPLVLAFVVLLAGHERWFGANAYHFRDFTLEERLLTQGRALWLYLRLIFLPDIAKMGLYHDGFPLSQGLIEPVTTLPAVLGTVGLLAAAVVTRVRQPVLFFGILWFFVGHSMESSVFALEMIHEHRNYLPQYGLLFAAVYFFAALYPQKALARTFRLRLCFLAIFAGLLGISTHARSIQWQDEQTLYIREVLNHPTSARAHTMLGAWMYHHGFLEDARRHLTIASNLTLHKAEHLIRLVQILYAAEHHVPEKILDELRYRLAHSRPSGVTLWVYQPLLQATRTNAEIHNQIIDLYAMVISRPDIDFGKRRYEASYYLLAENYAYRGRVREALQYYERARAINPRSEYDVAVVKLYAENGCYAKGKDLVAMLRARSDLGSNDEARLREVETLLADRNSSNSRCTL